VFSVQVVYDLGLFNTVTEGLANKGKRVQAALADLGKLSLLSNITHSLLVLYI
jgi:hypothetical protein